MYTVREPNPDSLSTMHCTKRVRIGLFHCVHKFMIKLVPTQIEHPIAAEGRLIFSLMTSSKIATKFQKTQSIFQS